MIFGDDEDEEMAGSDFAPFAPGPHSPPNSDEEAAFGDERVDSMSRRRGVEKHTWTLQEEDELRNLRNFNGPDREFVYREFCASFPDLNISKAAVHSKLDRMGLE